MIRPAVAALLLIAACHRIQPSTTAPQRYLEARKSLERGQFVRALDLAKEGAREFAQLPDYRELFTIVEAEATARSDPKGAIALLNQTPPSGNAEARVRRLMARGYAQQAGSDYDEAAATYTEADKLAVSIQPSLRGEIAMLRIAPPFHQGKWDTAEQFALQAIALGEADERPYVAAVGYGMLGTVEMNHRQWERALTHLSQGARLARAAQAGSVLSTITGNIGWCSQQLGDLDDAQARFTAVEKYAESQKVLRAQPTWLANIANVLVLREQYREALPYAERAVQVARQIENENKLATALSNLAQVQIELADYSRARTANDEALALRRKSGDRASQLTALLNAARIEDATGRADRALASLDSVIADAEDQPAVRTHAQATAAEIHRRLGRPAVAARMYEAALATGDAARGAIKEEDTYLVAFETNLIRFYDRYIDLLLGEGRVVEALRVAERSRARTLRDGLGLTADSQLDPRAIARKHDAAILWYWLARPRSLVWVITPEAVSVERLAPQNQIEAAIDSYRRETLARRSGIGNPRATAVFDMLVAPAVARTRRSRFIIIPDGRLNDLNLEAAVVSSPSPHYWIEDATVSYAPCLQLLAASKTRAPLRDGRILVIGNVPAQDGFPALARAGVEMTNVARHFDARRQVLLAGLGATRTAFLQSDLSHAEIIHFATHSTASVAAPLDSCVILSGTERLTGHDIAATRLNAELVTVSSCNSAGRRSYAGEGLVGLAWAFIRAGAKRVIASQWDISDAAASMAMDHMYSELASGHDPATALRTAKLALLHSKDAYEKPYYWAPFILYGAP